MGADRAGATFDVADWASIAPSPEMGDDVYCIVSIA